MALTKLSSVLLLLAQLLDVGVTSSAIVTRGTRRDTTGYFPQIDCPPAPMATSTSNGTAFRANLLALLASLPDLAAPTGFASTEAGGEGEGDRAFARGVCLGNPTPVQCHACLTAAVEDVVAGCGATSRRVGSWLDGCYLAYADTNTTSPSEKAFHRWFVTGVRRHPAIPRQRVPDVPRPERRPGAGGLRAVPSGLGASDAELLQGGAGECRERRHCAELRLRPSVQHVLGLLGAVDVKHWWNSPSVCPCRWSSSTSTDHVVMFD
ncbi:hypothetical protein E2562_016915 [Oryza meyeriana var. granulata]|uniref:Gnk2-homologous domain-containing protein n=1 Tax=Oryza meyeriana var. granulata TaxID=110450 RepID=A0A6G1DX85_9ORYZ|nr:hypothetical protein E2562_016915 [Oryza meyeriana var. granulata]